MLQVTAVFVAFPTEAANCCDAPRITMGVVGVTVTVTAGMVTVAVPDLEESCWETAVTVAVAGVVSVAGAVYSPVLLTVPGPVILQVTAGLAAFTATVNCNV